MRTYASSWVKTKSFYGKSELQMFLLISGGHMWRLHTKLCKSAWNVSANNSETVDHKDLRFGQIVHILVFYNISFFDSSTRQFLIYFVVLCLLRERENEEYSVIFYLHQNK